MTVLPEDEIGLCNCCLCQRELLGDRTARLINSGEAVTAAALPPPVADYARGRPICADCQRSRVQADKEEVARLRKGYTAALPGMEAPRMERGPKAVPHE